MEAFEYKAEECGLSPESDWELLDVTEKESYEEVGVLGRESPLLCISVWLCRANSIIQDAVAGFLPLWNAKEGSPSFLFCLAL